MVSQTAEPDISVVCSKRLNLEILCSLTVRRRQASSLGFGQTQDYAIVVHRKKLVRRNPDDARLTECEKAAKVDVKLMLVVFIQRRDVA